MYPERYADVYNKTSQNIKVIQSMLIEEEMIQYQDQQKILTTQQKLNKNTIMNQFKITLTL